MHDIGRRIFTGLCAFLFGVSGLWQPSYVKSVAAMAIVLFGRLHGEYAITSITYFFSVFLHDFFSSAQKILEIIFFNSFFLLSFRTDIEDRM